MEHDNETPEVLLRKAAKYIYTTKEYLILTVEYFNKMNLINKPSTETMATDEYFNLYYNPDFVIKNKKYLPGILFHELLHHIYDSFERADEILDRYGLLYAELWNICTDLVINEIVETLFPELDFKSIKNIVTYDSYIEALANTIAKQSNTDMKSVKNKLLKEISPHQSAEYYYYEVIRRVKPSNNAKGIIIRDLNKISHDFGSESRRNKHKENNKSSAIDDMIKRGIEDYAKKEIKRRGFGSGNSEIILSKNLNRTDKTTAQKILQIVKEKINLLYEKDRKKISKKYYINKIFIKDTILINKSKKSFDINIAFCVDTSGSMVGEEINEVFSKIESLLYSLEKNSEAQFRIRYIECDAEISENILFDNFRSFRFYIKNKKHAKGAGGTSVIPPLNFLLNDKNPFGNSKKSDIIVYFTDGYIDDPEDILPIIKNLRNIQKT